MAFILFFGGIRSGKTRLAEIWGEAASPNRLLISTTLTPVSKTFSKKVNPESWQYITDPLEPLNKLQKFKNENQTYNGSIILDSIGTWIGNLMAQNLTGNDILRRVAMASRTFNSLDLPCAIVSEEAGLTPAPTSSVTKKFVDLLGIANQVLARDSHCTIMVIAGIPVLLKGSMPAVLDRVIRGSV